MRGLCAATRRLGGARWGWIALGWRCERRGGAAAGHVLELGVAEEMLRGLDAVEGAEGAERQRTQRLERVQRRQGRQRVRHLLSPNCQLRRHLAPLAKGCIGLCGSTAVDAPVNNTAAHA